MYETSPATRALKRSKWLTVAVRIVRDRRAGMRMRREVVEKTMGSTHRGFDVEQSVAYVDAVFADYLTYAGLSEADLKGARVMELGPGDNLGVALRFLAAGAERVQGVDRFATWRDPAQQKEIYAALLERMDPVGRARAAAAVRLGSEPGFDPDRLQLTEGLPIEEAADRFEPGSFDLIVSRAVIEHVYDTDATFEAIDRLLRPGGASIHKIDLEDHGLFTVGGLHPLTFLTVPDRIYRWMGENSGLPNRRLADYYRAKMDALGYDWRLFSTHLIGEEGELVPHPEEIEPGRLAAQRRLVAEIRPKLRPRFRRLRDEDLAVSGVFLVSRKPMG